MEKKNYRLHTANKSVFSLYKEYIIIALICLPDWTNTFHDNAIYYYLFKAIGMCLLSVIATYLIYKHNYLIYKRFLYMYGVSQSLTCISTLITGYLMIAVIIDQAKMHEANLSLKIIALKIILYSPILIYVFFFYIKYIVKAIFLLIKPVNIIDSNIEIINVDDSGYFYQIKYKFTVNGKEYNGEDEVLDTRFKELQDNNQSLKIIYCTSYPKFNLILNQR